MSEHPLTVRPTVVQTKRYRQPSHSQLGPLPARYCFAAASGSGKTEAALTAARALLPVMDRVHLFSGSIEHDPALEPFKALVKEHLRKRAVSFDEEEPFHSSLKDLDVQISEAAKRSKEAEAHGGGFQTLFFIDDLLSQYRGAAATKTLERLFYQGRHFGITVLLLSQSYRTGISPVIRRQFSHIGCWAGQPAEIEAIREEVGGDPKIFDEAFNIATKKPHAFLWIRLGNTPEYFSSFTKRLVRP